MSQLFDTLSHYWILIAERYCEEDFEQMKSKFWNNHGDEVNTLEEELKDDFSVKTLVAGVLFQSHKQYMVDKLGIRGIKFPKGYETLVT